MIFFIFQLPFLFLKFWYIEAPIGLFSYFSSLNISLSRLMSIALLIKTYFKPWKNEYREGLVGFSIGMGIFIKTFIILTDMVIIMSVLVFEIIIFLGFIFLPLATLTLMFYKSFL